MDATATQHINHSLVKTKAGARMLAGGIDGSVTPQLIPDSTAYRLFLLTMTVPPGAPPSERLRQAAFLSHIPMSPGDYDVFITVMTKFEADMDKLGLAPTSTRPPLAVNDPTALDSACNMAVTTARNTLRSRLSAAALLALENHVQSEKRRMLVFPVPVMASK